MRQKIAITVIGIAGALVVASGGMAVAAYSGVAANGQIMACWKNSGAANLRIVDHFPCKKGETPLTWNQKGVKGDAGAAGAAGAAGVGGAAGATGAAGLPGAKGDTGAAGATGPAGLAGTNGADGSKGDAGPAGPAGVSGTDGPAGPRGPAGVEGAAGSAGAQGPPGVQGSVGPDGTAGAKGDTGSQGVQGPAGDRGVAGPQGEKGDTGASGATITGSCPANEYVSGINAGQLVCTPLSAPAGDPDPDPDPVGSVASCYADAPGGAQHIDISWDGVHGADGKVLLYDSVGGTCSGVPYYEGDMIQNGVWTSCTNYSGESAASWTGMSATDWICWNGSPQ